MIHLLAAHKLQTEPDALFCVGTVAPDAVKTREDKDKTHFRILCNREEALANLAKNTSDSFGEGVLLHLYLDWLWDDQAYHVFSKQHHEDGWFLTYRNEIAKAGSYIYHHYSWSERAFLKMLSCPAKLYGQTPGASEAGFE
jgi:menaquinone-dependent protoporphyrinogen IX oxidase